MRESLKIDAELSRNVKVTIAALKGVAFGEISKEERISRQRVSQIIHRICYWADPELYDGLREKLQNSPEALRKGVKGPSIDALRDHKERLFCAIREKSAKAKQDRAIRSAA